MSENSRFETLYNKAISQSKELLKNELLKKELNRVVEARVNRIDMRLRTKEIQVIEKGYVLRNGVELKLIVSNDIVKVPKITVAPEVKKLSIFKRIYNFFLVD